MRKIKLIPMQKDKSVRRTTPKNDFFRWCLLNTNRLAEMANEVDYCLFDDLWEQVKEIFLLDNLGRHITGDGSCAECVYGEDDETTVGSPCWNCKSSNRLFEQQSN